MATTCWSSRWLLPLSRRTGGPRRTTLLRTGSQNVRSLHRSSVAVPGKDGTSENEFVNSATLEHGVTKYFCNRNPRNLELLGVAEKPKGFEKMRYRVDYHHRLMFDVSSRHVSAYVDHSNGTKVVEASTKEFCISRHLYKTSDVAAAYNIGRVIAQRCKETGLYRVMWEHKWGRNHKKVQAFIRAVSESGIRLNEPRVRRELPPAGELPR